MTPEYELIPYHCCELPPGPWLIFAPHADDETFGMAGALALAADQQLQTHVVILTDGALGGDGSEPELIDTRKREVAAACELLNVATLQTWPLPDRGLRQDDAVIERIATTIADINPGTVFFPGVLEIHPDHRAAALLVWTATQRLQQRAWRQLMPQLWSYDISVQSPTNRLLDITTKVALKQQAMAIYASQNSQNNYPDLILALNKARTYSLPPDVTHAEAFYCYAPEQLSGALHEAAEAAWRRYWR